jgi:NAD(P)-dependent dehydrogenase (short-subunit alcohol dehydrogenase family)
MSKLAERTALVTGAGRGIGRAIAIALAAEGARVVLAARSQDELDNVVAEIQAAGGTAFGLTVDLSQREQTKKLIERANETAGPIDILVNNAGVGSSQDARPLAEFNDDFWDLTLEVNTTVPYLLSKAALPHMFEQKWGRIITVSSINGRIAVENGGAYIASKHGVLGLMRSLALEVAKTGVTVNSICPGPVKTRMNNARVEYDAKRLGRDVAEHEYGLTPIGGRLEPDDIAPMAVYLASDDARMITGQSYNIDGGISMP